MKPRDGRPTYLSILLKKYGLGNREIVKATGATRQAAYNWTDAGSWPTALYLPKLIALLQRYEPSLTMESLIKRENAARKGGSSGARASRSQAARR